MRGEALAAGAHHPQAVHGGGAGEQLHAPARRGGQRGDVARQEGQRHVLHQLRVARQHGERPGHHHQVRLLPRGPPERGEPHHVRGRAQGARQHHQEAGVLPLLLRAQLQRAPRLGEGQRAEPDHRDGDDAAGAGQLRVRGRQAGGQVQRGERERVRGPQDPPGGPDGGGRPVPAGGDEPDDEHLPGAAQHHLDRRQRDQPDHAGPAGLPGLLHRQAPRDALPPPLPGQQPAAPPEGVRGAGHLLHGVVPDGPVPHPVPGPAGRHRARRQLAPVRRAGPHGRGGHDVEPGPAVPPLGADPLLVLLHARDGDAHRAPRHPAGPPPPAHPAAGRRRQRVVRPGGGVAAGVPRQGAVLPGRGAAVRVRVEQRPARRHRGDGRGAPGRGGLQRVAGQDGPPRGPDPPRGGVLQAVRGGARALVQRVQGGAGVRHRRHAARVLGGHPALPGGEFVRYGAALCLLRDPGARRLPVLGALRRAPLHDPGGLAQGGSF